MPAPPRFISWHDFHEDSLHHPAWGYYCDGRVAFGEEGGSADDFTTFPVSMRPIFGAMLADRLHSLWLAQDNLLDGCDADADDPFLVVELGAGTGVLAHDVLSHCEAALPALYAKLTYVIGERSHALRALQAQTNNRFVAAGKLRIVPADARDLRGSALRETLLEVAAQAREPPRPPRRLRGAAISNELPDAFGVERVLVGLSSGGGGQATEEPAAGPGGAPAAAAVAAKSDGPIAARRPPPLRGPSLDPAAWQALAASGGGGGGGGGGGAARGGGGKMGAASGERAHLTLQRGVVIPLIRAQALTELLLASGSPLPPNLAPAEIASASRAARAALLAGLRNGTWELGCAGEQCVASAAQALHEWLTVPPPPTPPPPLALRSPLGSNESSWAGFWGRAGAAAAAAIGSPPSWATGRPGGGAGAGGAAGRLAGGAAAPSHAPRSAPHPSEWIFLPREAYCAIKGRCCASQAAAPSALARGASGASGDPPAEGTDRWGTPLEVALDRAVVIGEAFETIDLPDVEGEGDGEGQGGQGGEDAAGSEAAGAALTPRTGGMLQRGSFGSAALQRGSPPVPAPQSREALPAAAGGSPAEGTTRAAADGASDAPLARWLTLHAPLLRSALRHRPAGERLELYPNPSLHALAAGLAGLFVDGAVITIDYGADAATLINAARRVAPRPPHGAPEAPTADSVDDATPSSRSHAGLRIRSRLPCLPGECDTLKLSRPGWSDLTTDVDFTELAAAGERNGLQTIFFGPQTLLQRVCTTPHGAMSAVATTPPRVANAQPALRPAVLDAFYSLGSFVMLVQATPAVAELWRWGAASQPLYGAGHPSLGAMALHHTARTLGRLTLEYALELQHGRRPVPTATGFGPDGAAGEPLADRSEPLADRSDSALAPLAVPSDVDLIGALSDALLPSVKCFRPFWRRVATEVLQILREQGGQGGQGGQGAAPERPPPPPLLRSALAIVREDLKLVACLRGAGVQSNGKGLAATCV